MNCEVNIDDCDPNPCSNSAACEDLIDDYYCECGVDWMGKNCELVSMAIQRFPTIVDDYDIDPVC